MTDHRENMNMRALYWLAMIFVVDGHIPLVNLFDFGGFYGYYSFHLILFAFGSGYFFHLYGGVKNDLVTRAKKLLVPLYVWNLVYGIFAAGLRRFGGFELGEALSLQTILLSPLTDGEHFRWNLGCWYLFPLFLVQVIYAGLSRILGKQKRGCEICFLVSLVLGSVAVEICHLEKQNLLPLWVLRTLILLPGYAGGAFYRERIEGRVRMPAALFPVACIAGRAVLLLMFGNLSYLLSSCTYFSCNAIGVYAGAACATGFYLGISRLLAPLLEKTRLLLFMARNTMDIMDSLSSTQCFSC